MAKQQWDPAFYDKTVNFVTTYGEDVLTLLHPQAGERILDLGCGTGHLTAQISKAKATVYGMDASYSMIEQAQQLYPEIPFFVGNGETFQLEEPVDAVFSNAALHWMKNAREVVSNVKNHLRVGGRFVAEMGGKGNVAIITNALYQALAEHGIKKEQINNPWYFPSVAEYTTLLEEEGFQISYVLYFERPTVLEDCPNGLKEWIRNFAHIFIEKVSIDKQDSVMARVNELTKPLLYKDGKWYADYKRLRFLAVKK